MTYNPCTYRQLLVKLARLSDDQLEDLIVVDINDEIYQAYLTIADDDDVLHKNHVVIKTIS